MQYQFKIIILTIIVAFKGFSQNIDFEKDSIMIRKMYDIALSEGKAYEDLRSLCKDVGSRLSGSAQAEMAVVWGKEKLESYNFDTVYLQDIMVPHWERGSQETGWFRIGDEKNQKVNLIALGGSIATNGLMHGELIMFETRDDLLKASRKEVEGKIVFISQPMDEKMISTFNAYGGCYPIRGLGSVDAAKLGAKALVIRSLSLAEHDHPHTGSLRYEEGVNKIPAAALSTNDATLLYNKIKNSDEKVTFSLELNCKTHPDKPSHNVVAELRGTKYPNKVITIGGHLDSWDLGEGAHDDGAGIVHTMEALRILKELNYRPNYTLRVVFFMNEENGNMGGKTYAQLVHEKGEEHVAAIESDRGGFTPRGFSLDGMDEQLFLLESFSRLFEPYEVHKFVKGYGGVDIGPLKEFYPSAALIGFVPDSQRYFDFHHNANDVFENVNKRELELGAATISALLYLLDKYFI